MAYEDDKRELELALMNAQIEKLNIERDKLSAEAERFRQEMRWEPYKAFATIIAGIAAMTGVILAVAHYIRP
jgi:hypothetical protein